MNNKINKNAKLLMISDLIYSITAIFANTFLVAYFLKITDENITTISIYYLIFYFLLGNGIILIGRFVKKYINHSNKILSLGIVVRALFILFIVVLADRIAQYFILVAIIFAISEILYWCAHELLYFDVTTNNNRKKYMSIKKILSKITNIIIPIILGSSIELYSFSMIAIYILILSIIQIIVSLLIKTNIISNNVIQYDSYSLKSLINFIKENKLSKIKIYQMSAIAYGVVESSISTLIVIMIIMTFKTNINLGILTTVFAICSILSLYLYNKFYDKRKSKFFLLITSILMIISVVGLLFDINKITLIIYNFAYAVSMCIFDVIYNTKKGDLVQECNIVKYQIEFIGYCSIFISIGRILGYVFILIASFGTDIYIFKILLLIVTLFAPIYSLLVIKIEELN